MTVPKGSLPVWSCDTEEEAKSLIVATCPRGPNGKFYARELAAEQTLENLGAFSRKLKMVSEVMAENRKANMATKKKAAFDPEAVATEHFEAFEKDCKPEHCSKEQWKEALEELISHAQSSLGAVKSELNHDDDEDGDDED